MARFHTGMVKVQLVFHRFSEESGLSMVLHAGVNLVRSMIPNGPGGGHWSFLICLLLVRQVRFGIWWSSRGHMSSI